MGLSMIASISLHLLAELPPLRNPLLVPLRRLLQILAQTRLPQLRLLGQRRLRAGHRMTMVEVKVLAEVGTGTVSVNSTTSNQAFFSFFFPPVELKKSFL
jgi:hypothetical protein